MRVLILHSRYLSGPVSGENRVVDDEARLLREAGHEVHVWTPSPEAFGPLDRYRVAAGAVWSHEAVRDVRELLRLHRPEVVHCHNLFPMLSPAVLRATNREAAVVLTLHNYRLLCLPASFLRGGKVCEACLGRLPWRGVVYGCYRGSRAASGALATSIALHRALRTFDQVDLFLAPSRFLRDKHLEAGFPASRMLVKPNFAHQGSVRRGAGEYFLYAGRLSPEKGVATLLRAWRGMTAPLLVVGDGPDAAPLRGQAPPHVNFCGQVSGDRATELLAGARALLIPSIWYEGMPRIVLEAYAAGVPVIASRVGALPEILDEGVTGLLVPPHDTDAWTRAVERLRNDSESEALGAGARRLWLERYTPEQALIALEEAYERALAIRVSR